MTIGYQDFIAAFPEFATGPYTVDQTTFWIGQGYGQLNARRFGAQLDLGVMLFTGHNLSLSAQAIVGAEKGGLPGKTVSPVASESVGPVSVTYDTKATAIDGAGMWNATVYGQRLYALMRMFNKGPTYVPGPRRRYTGPIYR